MGTTKHRGRCADPGGWAVARETAAGSPQGETPRDGANQHCRKAARRVRRVGTSESNKAEAVLGRAKLALCFQIPPQASLHGITEIPSLIRCADGPAALRAGISRRKCGVALGLPSGEMF